MVGNPDAVDPELDGACSVGWMHDALEHKGALPALAEAGDLIPGEGPADLVARERNDLVSAGVRAGVGLEVGKARMAFARQRREPAGRAQHIEDHARVGAELAATKPDHHL